MGEGHGRGPLQGVTVVELAGIGPGPFCVMMLADMGATVIRVDRVGGPSVDYTPNPVIERGRRSIALDLKSSTGVDLLLRLVERSDVLIESFRPGVAERLGFGPDVCRRINARLVYGRLSAWGQDGPSAGVAGHDINYLAMAGVLHSIGRAGERPVPPLNLIGDFGGGASSLAFGVVCALLEVGRSGIGTVVDANVLDSTTSLMGLVHGLRAQGRWRAERGTNLLDSGCPYYDVYTCADGRWMAIGAIEERFFLNALGILGLADDQVLRASHRDRTLWPVLRAALTRAFVRRTRDEWAAAFADSDTCVSPVLDLDESAVHPHAEHRRLYRPIVGYPGSLQPAVSPRFDGGTLPTPGAAPKPGEHSLEILLELGFDRDAVDHWLEAGVVAERSP